MEEKIDLTRVQIVTSEGKKKEQRTLVHASLNRQLPRLVGVATSRDEESSFPGLNEQIAEVRGETVAAEEGVL
uniref:Uncharacterized protein n=1 Tax=Nelumbo nucifera TaxID=4432 RepID=A0A822YWJ3_NELNU|nr:TPA_asm: hypothetical protein HUJ06_006359 [Nelumbo nucifera]